MVLIAPVAAAVNAMNCRLARQCHHQYCHWQFDAPPSAYDRAATRKQPFMHCIHANMSMAKGQEAFALPWNAKGPVGKLTPTKQPCTVYKLCTHDCCARQATGLNSGTQTAQRTCTLHLCCKRTRR